MKVPSNLSGFVCLRLSADAMTEPPRNAQEMNISRACHRDPKVRNLYLAKVRILYPTQGAPIGLYLVIHRVH